jgi:hypothetical protein
VRSSYKAGEVFLKSLLGTDDVAAPLEERIERARQNAARVRSEHEAERPPPRTDDTLLPAASLVRPR